MKISLQLRWLISQALLFSTSNVSLQGYTPLSSVKCGPRNHRKWFWAAPCLLRYICVVFSAKYAISPTGTVKKIDIVPTITQASSKHPDDGPVDLDFMCIYRFIALELHGQALEYYLFYSLYRTLLHWGAALGPSCALCRLRHTKCYCQITEDFLHSLRKSELVAEINNQYPTFLRVFSYLVRCSQRESIGEFSVKTGSMDLAVTILILNKMAAKSCFLEMVATSDCRAPVFSHSHTFTLVFNP